MKDSETTVMPDGWVNITVGDAVISISTNGKKIRQKEYAEHGRYAVVDQGQEKIGGYTDDEEILVDCQLPVIVFGDHTRLIKYVNQPFAAGADGIKVLQPHKFVDSRFLEHCLRHISESMVSKGYARHYQHLAKSNFPLPPLPEQLRIVAKLEEILSELDKGIESFKTAREQLKVYRLALLKHTFEGKLTAAWREENKDKLETADVLLKRIQAERAERYRLQVKEWERAVKGWEKGGKKGSTPGKPSKPKELLPLTVYELAELPELPDGWGWASVITACESVVDCHNKTAPYQSSGIYLIRTTNIRDGKLNLFGEIRYVSDKTYEYWSRRCPPQPGDVLFTREAPMGEAAIIPIDTKICMGQRIMLFRPFEAMLCSSYLLNAVQEPKFKRRMESAAIGTGVKHLRVGDVEKLKIPICSYSEQLVITKELDARLSEVDQLDQTITTALQQAETLCQSILKKAFSGQLVPQDPSDEPASVLLERIKAERAVNNRANSSSPLHRPARKSRKAGDHP